ncbi:MAG: putative quinol monooxygenase [Variovorax sp.]
MKPGCTIIGNIHGRPEKREALLALLQTFIVPTRQEPGCIEYQFHVSAEDPNHFMFYENWVSREVLAEHIAMPYIQPIVDREDELLARPVHIVHYEMLAPLQAVNATEGERGTVRADA